MKDYHELLDNSPDFWMFSTAIAPELAISMIDELSNLLGMKMESKSVNRIKKISECDFWENDECFLFQMEKKLILLYCKSYCDFFAVYVKIPLALKDIVHPLIVKYQIMTDGGMGIIKIQHTPENSLENESTNFVLNECIKILSKKS
ncbi:MAG TPA: hypothetical protein DCO72_01010 [Ruminococcus sp.]|nr:hypothetical protein [Ruminococcus sp.]